MNTRDRVYSTCRDIVAELMKCQNAHLFFKPVDPESDGAPGYYEQVSRSMSFYQIQEKLDNYEYRNPDEFVDDLMLIWKNAKSYNADENHIVHRTAVAMAKKSQILVSLLPHYYTDDEKDSGLHRYVELRINRYRLWKKSHL